MQRDGRKHKFRRKVEGEVSETEVEGALPAREGRTRPTDIFVMNILRYF